MVRVALNETQWTTASSVDDGVEIESIEADICGLDEAIEEARLHWRQVKTLEAREVYEQTLKERRTLVDHLQDLKSKNTSLLLSMEEAALKRASDKGDLLGAVRAVVVGIDFDTECKRLTLRTISGKRITVDRTDWQPEGSL